MLSGTCCGGAPLCSRIRVRAHIWAPISGVTVRPGLRIGEPGGYGVTNMADTASHPQSHGRPTPHATGTRTPRGRSPEGRARWLAHPVNHGAFGSAITQTWQPGRAAGVASPISSNIYLHRLAT